MRYSLLIIFLVLFFFLHALIDIYPDLTWIDSTVMGISEEESKAFSANPAYVNFIRTHNIASNFELLSNGIEFSSLYSSNKGELNFCIFSSISDIEQWQSKPFSWNYYSNEFEMYENGYVDNNTPTFSDDYVVNKNCDGAYYNNLEQFGKNFDFRIALGKNNHGFLYQFKTSNLNFVPDGIHYQFEDLTITEVGDSALVESMQISSHLVNENATSFSMHSLSWGIIFNQNLRKIFDFSFNLTYTTLSESNKSASIASYNFDPDEDGNIVYNSYGWESDYQLCKTYNEEIYENSEYKLNSIGFGGSFGYQNQKTDNLKFSFEGTCFLQSMSSNKIDYDFYRLREALCIEGNFYEGFSDEEKFITQFSDYSSKKITNSFGKYLFNASANYTLFKHLTMKGSILLDVSSNIKKIYLQKGSCLNKNLVKSELIFPLGVIWNYQSKLKLSGILQPTMFIQTFDSDLNYRSRNSGYITLNLTLSTFWNISKQHQIGVSRYRDSDYIDPIYSLTYRYIF